MLAFALVAAPAAATTAAFAEAGGPSGLQAVSPTTVDAVNESADRVAAFWAAEGFGKTVVDYEKAEVSVYWKGTLPAAVSKTIGLQKNGVRVVARPALHSDAEIRAAARKVLMSERARTGEITIATITANPDMSGLVVEAVQGSKTAAADAAETRARFETVAGMPAQTKLVPGRPDDITRQNDSAPWQGGGALYNRSDGDCSTGFAVLTGSGSGRLLSAGHCGSLGSIMYDGVGDRIGVVSNVLPGYDSMLIDPDASPATIGKVFGGAWNASTSDSRYQYYVGSAVAPSENQWLCTSGAMSGEHCSVTVTSVAATWLCYRGTEVCSGFRATAFGPVVAAKGDSGGPIYNGVYSARVARGIMTGAENSVACGSTAGSTTCYSTVLGMSISVLLAEHKVTIETGP